MVVLGEFHLDVLQPRRRLRAEVHDDVEDRPAGAACPCDGCRPRWPGRSAASGRARRTPAGRTRAKNPRSSSRHSGSRMKAPWRSVSVKIIASPLLKALRPRPDRVATCAACHHGRRWPGRERAWGAGSAAGFDHTTARPLSPSWVPAGEGKRQVISRRRPLAVRLHLGRWIAYSAPRLQH
jgi:hypothetical protein